MQLTQFTDFSLRVLMYLSHRERSNLVTITEIAQQFDIPRNHLVKVVNNLVKQGWVAAVRGRNGGLQLAVAPTDVHLGCLIRQLENHSTLINCSKTDCQLMGQCQLQNILVDAMQAFFDGLDQYTLADVIAEPTGTVLINMHRNYVGATTR